MVALSEQLPKQVAAVVCCSPKDCQLEKGLVPRPGPDEGAKSY